MIATKTTTTTTITITMMTKAASVRGRRLVLGFLDADAGLCLAAAREPDGEEEEEHNGSDRAGRGDDDSHLSRAGGVGSDVEGRLALEDVGLVDGLLACDNVAHDNVDGVDVVVGVVEPFQTPSQPPVLQLVEAPDREPLRAPAVERHIPARNDRSAAALHAAGGPVVAEQGILDARVQHRGRARPLGLELQRVDPDAPDAARSHLLERRAVDEPGVVGLEAGRVREVEFGARECAVLVGVPARESLLADELLDPAPQVRGVARLVK
mmetsp:Transcript_47173/g.111222  ORF Transcript_47173/g.111222 Transcript_47173/m.111222 type:complete len:267 (-) Transcript_47173:1472-2272(-)